MRYSLAILTCMFIWVAARPWDVSAQCNLCLDCGEGHENVADADLGNEDALHPCYSHTCLWMQYEGVHRFTCYWEDAPEAYDAFFSKEVMTRKEAESLVASYPEHIVLDPSNRFVQVLDCEGNLVVAQAEIKDDRAVRPMRWLQLNRFVGRIG
jgi:hypothetical protein